MGLAMDQLPLLPLLVNDFSYKDGMVVGIEFKASVNRMFLARLCGLDDADIVLPRWMALGFEQSGCYTRE